MVISSNGYMRKLTREIGEAVKKTAARNRENGWYTPHMAAASRAIAERIPLADFIVEVRDARVPLSSEYELLRNCIPPSRRIIVMNKMDLANRSQLKDWITYFDQPNCVSFSLNSHNKDSVKQFLNFLQSQIRKLKNIDNGHTITMMVVGIPNVGKSALCNSLHHIGRIAALEKGKLKHAKVTPHPGETKDISSLKIGSHPNIYVLDTPGILPPQILDAEICSKLAITGAIRDCLVGEKQLAQYFLAILNLGDEYKKWGKLSTHGNDISYIANKAECSSEGQSSTNQKRLTDHTQDIVVHDVRRILYETISSFDGKLEKEMGMEQLIETQFTALEEAFQVPTEFGDAPYCKVATKLLNLYRTGRLGHFTLDPLASTSQDTTFLLD
ncbi:Mitochondrial ribosome-associated GTPase 1 [Euphorbia peplus]|nr:Mitochondrial ribosome-associated GTPase 1 [Euphorbia peplus]